MLFAFLLYFIMIKGIDKLKKSSSSTVVYIPYKDIYHLQFSFWWRFFDRFIRYIILYDTVDMIRFPDLINIVLNIFDEHIYGVAASSGVKFSWSAFFSH